MAGEAATIACLHRVVRRPRPTAELRRAVVGERLLELGGGVHDERSVTLDGLTDRPTLQQEALDLVVARALSAMKAEPARRWTVASLARIAGLSRAAFARRFVFATNTSPLRWLTCHRLAVAQVRLVTTDDGLAAIAADVGYASEFALAKAFKRLFGVAPGRFRRAIRSTTPPPNIQAASSFRVAA